MLDHTNGQRGSNGEEKTDMKERERRDGDVTRGKECRCSDDGKCTGGMNGK